MAQQSQNNRPAQAAPQQSRAITTQETAVSRLKNPAMVNALTSVLPKGIDVQRWLSIVAAEIKGPALERVTDPSSILVGVFHGAKLGLSFNKNMGEAYLVPFRDNKSGKTLAQFIPGYKGLVKLARNAGVSDIQSTCVHQRDNFQHWEDETGFHYRLEVSPEKDRGDVICVITRAKLSDGSISVKPTWLDKLTRIKAAAMRKTNGTGPWSTHEEEMFAKTGIRHHCKTLPQTEELAMAIRAEEKASEGRFSGDLPEELLTIGAVDAQYQEVASAAADAPEQAAGKAVASAPKSKAETEARFKFESTVVDICISKNIDCDGMLLAEFGYASLADVSPQDFDKVLTHFKGK